MKAAVIQMVSQDDVLANLQRAGALTRPDQSLVDAVDLLHIGFQSVVEHAGHRVACNRAQGWACTAFVAGLVPTRAPGLPYSHGQDPVGTQVHGR